MLLRACKNFERFFDLAEGEAHEEGIDEHSLKVPGWAGANVKEFADIQRRKDQRESDSLIGGCSMVTDDRGLFPLIEKTLQGLNSVSPAEWVLINVIADSGHAKKLCPRAYVATLHSGNEKRVEPE